MPTLLMMIGSSGLELLVLIVQVRTETGFGFVLLIGAISGYFFRAKNGKALGVILGIVGASLTTLLLSRLVPMDMLFMPVYVMLGAWLFNFIWTKIFG